MPNRVHIYNFGLGTAAQAEDAGAFGRWAAAARKIAVEVSSHGRLRGQAINLREMKYSTDEYAITKRVDESI